MRGRHVRSRTSVEIVKVGQKPNGGTLKTMYQSMNGSGSVRSSYFSRDAPSAVD
jgi:hypothetical protein